VSCVKSVSFVLSTFDVGTVHVHEYVVVVVELLVTDEVVFNTTVFVKFIFSSFVV
jgi:hypothetical protein